MRKTAHELRRIVPSDITPYDKYVSRRALLAGGVGLAAAQTLGRWGESFAEASPADLTYTHNAAFSVTEAPNSYRDISTYNNYYEFGTDKSDPAQNAQGFRPQPWKVTVSGEAAVFGSDALEDIFKQNP